MFPLFSDVLYKLFNEPIKKIFESMTTDDITHFFVIIIVLFFIFFVSVVVFNSLYRIINLINVRRKIYTLLEGDSFPVNNLHKFKEISGETKIFSCILQENNGIVYAVQDVETFSHALWSPPLLRSRVIPFGTALLTGLGVLGTFVGLLIGLGGLQLDGNMENLQAEIRQVAQGASVAFETSVWGVSLSLVLTIIKKILFSLVNRKLIKLQSTFSELFPPFPFASVLCDMSRYSRESGNHLGGLAEKIGDRMQRSLDGLSDRMFTNLTDSIATASRQISEAISNSLQETLANTLVPPVNRMADVSRALAERQAHSSEKALESLLQQFMGEIGKAGNGQREAMQEATTEMQTTMSKFANSMTELVTSIKQQQSEMAVRQQQQLEELDKAFQRLGNEQSENISKANKEILAVLSEFRIGVRDELARQVKEMGKASDAVLSSQKGMADSLHGFLKELKIYQVEIVADQNHHSQVVENQIRENYERQSSSLNAIAKLVQDHTESTKSLLDQGKLLQSQLKKDGQTFTVASEAMHEAGNSMASAGKDMQSFGAQIKDGVINGSQIVERAVTIVGRLAAQEDNISKRMETLIHEISNIKSDIDRITNSISMSVNTAQTSYTQLSKHYDELQQVLKLHMKEINMQTQEQLKNMSEQMSSHIEALDEHMAKLLIDYTSQASANQDRQMSAWNSQTKDFCDKMVQVTEAMAEVVDGLDRPERR